MEPKTPLEETAAVFRFETKLAAEQSAEFQVTEERELGVEVVLGNSDDDGTRFVISLKESSDELKGQLAEALTRKGEWDAIRRESDRVMINPARITADQDRIRKTLRETPERAEVYAEYLKELDDQEKELDAQTDKQKKFMAAEFAAKKQYEDDLSHLRD